MIDDLAGTPWPKNVLDAGEPFLQGHLIERPPFFYVADLREPVWSLTRAVARDTSEDERGEELLELENRPPYGIITTQSCDLAEESRAPRKPWLSVAPVYTVTEDSPVLRRDEIHRLDPHGLPAGIWVADLRIEVPLEKSVLVDRAPIRAFPDEAGEIAFGNYLARRRGRPALASVFHDVINETMKALREESNARKKQRRRVRERVYQLRLSVQDGTRLAPKAAKLWVICTDEPDEETKDWFGAWFDHARLVARHAGLRLLPVGYIDAQRADVTLYDQLIEIRNPLRK